MMPGILDTLTDAPKFDVQKPEGMFAGPLIMSEATPPQEPNRLDQMLGELNEQDRFDVLQEIRKSDRKSFSPDYIYKKEYKKNPYSFFNDGYDANVESEINPEAIETEFSDFITLFNDPKTMNKVMGSETLSPFAQDLIPELGKYREQHQVLPNSFKDFIQNRVTGKS